MGIHKAASQEHLQDANAGYFVVVLTNVEEPEVEYLGR